MLIAGIYVIKRRTITSATTYGKIATPPREREIFANLHAINRQRPRGGVACPIVRLMHMIMPKCKGEIPYSIAMGARMGAIIIREAEPSMKVPINRRSRFTAIRNIKGVLR